MAVQSIPVPLRTLGQSVFLIGAAKVITGEVTQISYKVPSGQTAGSIFYTVSFNRGLVNELSTEYAETAVFASHADAVTAYGNA
jgi:hypothetical protein